MYCNKCHKELPDGSGFCGYCGSKQEIEVIDNQSYQGPVKETKGISDKKMIVIIIIIIIIGVLVFAGGIYAYMAIQTSNSQNYQENNTTVGKSSEKESQEEKTEITENNKVVVTFYYENGEKKNEERAIENREKIVEYAYKLPVKLKNDLNDLTRETAIKNSMAGISSFDTCGLMDTSGATYYFECDTEIGNLSKTTFSDYGVISFNKIRYSKRKCFL